MEIEFEKKLKKAAVTTDFHKIDCPGFLTQEEDLGKKVSLMQATEKFRESTIPLGYKMDVIKDPKNGLIDYWLRDIRSRVMSKEIDEIILIKRVI